MKVSIYNYNYLSNRKEGIFGTVTLGQRKISFSIIKNEFSLYGQTERTTPIKNVSFSKETPFVEIESFVKTQTKQILKPALYQILEVLDKEDLEEIQIKIDQKLEECL